jgi:hypothetical protein
LSIFISGKGLAALTLDEDYQRRRQESLNRPPQNFGEGLTRGAIGVFQGENILETYFSLISFPISGVFEGATGVITKPYEGARQGGVGGFAKGVGKGLRLLFTLFVSLSPALNLHFQDCSAPWFVHFLVSSIVQAEHLTPSRRRKYYMPPLRVYQECN